VIPVVEGAFLWAVSILKLIKKPPKRSEEINEEIGLIKLDFGLLGKVVVHAEIVSIGQGLIKIL